MIKQYVLVIAVLFLIGFGAGIQQAHADDVTWCCPVIQGGGQCFPIAKYQFCPVDYWPQD